ncbi:MAG: 30S ribosomal protein S8e [Nanoarchaeota archaeon]|mgnify:CR=1 FL=1
MNKGRKTTGGKYHRNRKKRLHEYKSQENKTSLGETKSKITRTKGGHKRVILLKSNKANLVSGKKTEQVEIKNVLQTPQDIFLARQNRLIKGAVIETSKGKAKITNRPSREGVINAILIE